VTGVEQATLTKGERGSGGRDGKGADFFFALHSISLTHAELGEPMVIGTFTADLILQEPQTAAKPAQADPRAAAISAQAAERAADKALAAQIRQQIRTSISAAAQGKAEAVVPVPPTPPPTSRELVITGRNGEKTVISIPNSNDIIPQQVVDISIAFFLTMALIIIGLPLARAFARRMDRKSGGSAQVPAEVSAQLGHLSQAVDAIAVEVERISEGQRFTTRLLSEQRDAARDALPSGTNR
jgi:hypothetical protein